jgi:hypothetical protein
MAADGEARQDPPGPRPAGTREPVGAGSDGPAEADSFGPLRVARHRKEDGRSLILYSLRAEDPDRGG